MKVKKFLFSMTVLILMLTFLITPGIVYATQVEQPLYLLRVERNTEGNAYAIRYWDGVEQQMAKCLWNIVLQSGNSSHFDSNSSVFCLNADVGFKVTDTDEYDTYYDMKEDEAVVKDLSSMAVTNKNIKLEDNTEVLIYNAILALGDMVYIPGKSTETDKNELLAKVKELSKTDVDASTYYSQMGQYPLTDADIRAVEQAVFWYFSNYYKDNSNERDIRFDNVNYYDWLYYKGNGKLNYFQLSDSKYDSEGGAVRKAQAHVLYKYLIESSIENAKNYSTNTEVPVLVEPKTKKLDYVESGDNYIIGPIRINERKTVVPYEINMVVKNEGNVVTNPTLLNSTNSDDVIPSTKTTKDLVGQDFYILMPKNSVTSLSVDFNIQYTASTLILWTHSSNEINTQPVLVPKKFTKPASISLTVEPESKPFDLALRKYITKVNGADVTKTRVPNIDERTLASGTTASYKHRKDPVLVEKGDIVTYNIAVYNEGEKEGRATKIVDQLPAGLKFKRVVSGSFDADDSYNYDGDNKLILNRKASDTTNLPAYTSGDPASEIITIECEVMADPDTTNQKILTNIAWISEAFDEVDGRPYSGVDIGYDRDSAPGAHPNYNKDNMSNYTGNDNNKEYLNDSEYFYKGQQDDDDFEKIALDPKQFDLRLKKYISAINGDESKGKTISKIDTTKLANKTSTDADFTLSKNVVAAKHGDYVTYTFRVYNEGDLNGYVTKITDNIPLGLQFVQAKDDGKTITVYSYSAENGITSEDIEVDSTTYSMINTKNAQWTIDKNGTDVKTDTYDGDTTPSISLDVENYLGGTNTLLEAYDAADDTNKDGSNLKYVDLSVVLRVSEDAELNKVIRNEAAITGHKDENGNTDIIDRDSQPENWPGKDDHDAYQDDEDYDNIILKPFDLSLRKFIIAVSDDETIDNSEYLKKDGKYTRAPEVDTTKLNTTDSTTGKLITTATYNHPKQPVEVKKGDVVVYMLRVYNEGDIDGYAAEIKDHLPSNLEFVNGEFNEEYGWTISEDGRTATTEYLANQKIDAAKYIPVMIGGTNHYVLSSKEVPIMCRVKDTAKVDEKITNIADITKYLDENKQPINDRDSQEDNVNATEGNKPEYKDTEINRGDNYIPGQQDDDDFEKVIIPKFDLALRKQITSIYGAFSKKETKYDDRYAKLDNSRNNTIYNYYDVDSNIPTVVENDVVTYSIRVYNEGKVDGTATWVTDRLPSGLQYLPDDETNKEYGWKAFKQSSADNEKAVKIGEKYYEEVPFDSDDIYMYATEYLKDTSIKAYKGEGEATYGEVFMTTRVKAKSEVAEGTEFKLRNIAEIGDDDNDDDDSTPGDESNWKDQDDVDVEDLKLVEFDLALRKWVTHAIVIDNKGQTVTETGHQPYDDPEQVVKVELHRKKLNEVTVKFKYSIRIVNEGDIAGYAKEITDYIPQGLKFVAEDNPGWTDEGNNVVSTRLLEDTLLQPGEYADVEILLTWVNDQNNMGVMVNTAEISEDYNEYGVPDRDSTPDNKKWGEDDIDDAPVMLSISTGQMRIYFVLGFVVLITIAGGVVLIKKYVL